MSNNVFGVFCSVVVGVFVGIGTNNGPLAAAAMVAVLSNSIYFKEESR